MPQKDQIGALINALAEPKAEPEGDATPIYFDPLRLPYNAVKAVIQGLLGMPEQAKNLIEGAQAARQGEPINYAPYLGAAAMTMGGTPFSAPKGALGAGPAGRFAPSEAAQLAQKIHNGMNVPLHKLFPDLVSPTHTYGGLSPSGIADYLKNQQFGLKPLQVLNTFPQKLQGPLGNLLYKHLNPSMPGWGELEEHLISSKPPLSDEAIAAALHNNPGASIANIAGFWDDPSTAAQLAKALRIDKLPSQTPFQPSGDALAVGFNQPAVHGTTQVNRGPGGQIFSKFKLPETEIGVHFGSPRAAANFTHVPVEYFNQPEAWPRATGIPRSYPVVLQARNPLEMQDLGSWGPGRIARELTRTEVAPMHKGSVGAPGFDPKEVEQAMEDYSFRSMDPMVDQIKNLRNLIASKGYDSIKYTNTVEDPGHTSFIKFTPSSTQPNYVTGVRSPWAKFDPRNLDDPNVLKTVAGLTAGGALATNPDIQDIIRSLGK